MGSCIGRGRWVGCSFYGPLLTTWSSCASLTVPSFNCVAESRFRGCQSTACGTLSSTEVQVGCQILIQVFLFSMPQFTAGWMLNAFII